MPDARDTITRHLRRMEGGGDAGAREEVLELLYQELHREAERAMRQVLVDPARARHQQKREAHGQQVPLDRILVTYEERALDLVQLDEALERLAEFNPEMARAVELRFFGGATQAEAAQILGLSARTLDRRWAAARAWLRAELG